MPGAQQLLQLWQRQLLLGRQSVQSVSTFWYAAVLQALHSHLLWSKTMQVAALQ